MSDQSNTNTEFQISGDTLRKYTGQSRHLVISEDIKGIASAAFLDVTLLESVTIPDGVEFLDRRCFENCIHLKTISIPDSVTRIGEYAFSGCRDLDYVKLPAGLSRIESYTFRNCASLTAVIIPPGVTEIAVDAFIGCSSLESVHIHEGVTSFPTAFNHHPFTGCDKIKIYTPSGSAAERFAIENGIPHVIKTIDSPNQATDIVKPEDSKPKVTRQTIASTKGIFSYSDIEEYLPEDLTDKLLREAEEAEAAKKARIAAALAPAYSRESERTLEAYGTDDAYAADGSYIPDEFMTGSEPNRAESAEAVMSAPAETQAGMQRAVPAIEPTPVQEKPAAVETVTPATQVVKPVEVPKAVPAVEPMPVQEKPAVRETAVPVAEPMPVQKKPAEPVAVPKPASPVASKPVRPVEVQRPVQATTVPKPVQTAAQAPIPHAPVQTVPEPAREAETINTAEPAKPAEAVKAEKPARKSWLFREKKAPKEKPVKAKKPPKEKPVKVEKPPKAGKPPVEKPVKEKKEKKKKDPKPKASKGRSARIAALLVIAAVAVAVIVLAVINMNVTVPQTSDGPEVKTEEVQKDDYVLTLEDFVNSSDTARSQIDQSIDGTDVKVTVSGNKLIYTYDLSNTEGLSEDDADSDEIRKALEGTLDASNDRFVELCRSLEKDTGISGISVEVIYSYGDKILLTREYTANGQKN